MRTLRLLHRWTGGLIGLLLALLGLTGSILVHKDAWLRATLPHAAEAQIQSSAVLGRAVNQAFAPEDRPRSVVLASRSLGVHRLNYPDKSGAYADQTGEIVARWSSRWQRPEIWLFDLHHDLLMGDTGKTVAGVAALAGLGFVITGLILWWPTRRTFTFALTPRALTRPAVLKHHRDLGALAAPLLILSLLTGATLAIRPISSFLTSAFSPPAAMAAAQAAPEVKGGALSPDLDWSQIIARAQACFPRAEVRVVALPAKPGGLISIRLRQPREWLPNGRTQAWFDPADGRMVASRDAQLLPLGLRVGNSDYPLHAAKVGGLPYRLLTTAVGVALTLLGLLTVATFWSNPSGAPRRRRKTKSQA